MMYSTKIMENMDSMKFMTAAYGESHFISTSSTSICTATAGITDSILRIVRPMFASPLSEPMARLYLNMFLDLSLVHECKRFLN